MEAGLKLDTRVAEVVFDATVTERRSPNSVVTWLECSPPLNGDACPTCLYDGLWYKSDVPHFSTTFAAAWQVVEKMRELEYEINISYYPKQTWPDEAKDVPEGERWLVSFGAVPGTDMCWTHARSGTAPHVICLAALKALGEE